MSNIALPAFLAIPGKHGQCRFHSYERAVRRGALYSTTEDLLRWKQGRTGKPRLSPYAPSNKRVPESLVKPHRARDRRQVSRVGRSGGKFAHSLSGIQKNSSFPSGSQSTSVGRPHSPRIALMPRSRMWRSNGAA